MPEKKIVFCKLAEDNLTDKQRHAVQQRLLEEQWPVEGAQSAHVLGGVSRKGVVSVLFALLGSGKTKMCFLRMSRS